MKCQTMFSTRNCLRKLIRKREKNLEIDIFYFDSLLCWPYLSFSAKAKRTFHLFLGWRLEGLLPFGLITLWILVHFIASWIQLSFAPSKCMTSLTIQLVLIVRVGTIFLWRFLQAQYKQNNVGFTILLLLWITDLRSWWYRWRDWTLSGGKLRLYNKCFFFFFLEQRQCIQIFYFYLLLGSQKEKRQCASRIPNLGMVVSSWYSH